MYYTTPIYYVNGEPHIGHVFTSTIADVGSRYYRLCGEDVFFLTGSDEHGLKVQKTAESRGITPQAHCDELSKVFMRCAKQFDFTHDRFIRTTDEDHIKAACEIWRRLQENGFIYKAEYSGWYDVSDETFVVESSTEERTDKDGSIIRVCVDNDHKLIWVHEENYMFKLSAFEKPLLDYYKAHPHAIEPAFRQKEQMDFISKGLIDISVSRRKEKVSWGIPVPGDDNHPAFRQKEQMDFISKGLIDISVSRRKEKVSWGIPVPGDDNHVMYVWIDALTNYLTGVGFPDTFPEMIKPEGGEGIPPVAPLDPKHLWNGCVHLLGKDIVRFHCIYWPAFLIGAGIPLPPMWYVHGWWTKDKQKISKSLGNGFDPFDAQKEYGNDVLRYFLLRESHSTLDADFSHDKLVLRNNADLADDLGNLFKRVIAPALNPAQCLPEYTELLASKFTDDDTALIKAAEGLYAIVEGHMKILNCRDALADIWGVLRLANKRMQDAAPWVMMKNVKKTQGLIAMRKSDGADASDVVKKLEDEIESHLLSLNAVMFVVTECVRIVATLLFPFMPNKMGELFKQLGVPKSLIAINNDVLKVGAWREDRSFGKPGAILFSKMLTEEDKAKEDAKKKGKAGPVKGGKKAPKKPSGPVFPKDAPAIMSSFSKALIVCGRIIECKCVEDSDKLFLCKVDVSRGMKPKQVVTGLQHYYSAEELTGKKVACIINLKPAKLAGILSEAMILAGSFQEDGKSDETVKICAVHESCPLGYNVLVDKWPCAAPSDDSTCNAKQWKKITRALKCVGGCAGLEGMKLVCNGKDVVCPLPDGSEIH
ncbi:Methionine--tRNA ligase [Aduncisulcus paluster]|uniref:methionine--tRNA ligase n=1 Tax=Aduncisulcus paluster TaxID=2918883 RepID=A0ABQ5KL55_9EUKA|nr:Methionine--tRNA ligase [Aduncisulcus paluster]